MALSTRQSQAILNGTSRAAVAQSNVTSKQAGVSASSKSVINNLLANKPTTSTGVTPKVEVVQQAPAFDQAAYTQQANDMVNSIYEKQKQAELAQLYASKDKAIGQLNQQKAEVAPQYADKRNQSDVVSNQNVQRLREIMANSGLASSGENVTATVGLQNARQSALNGLNLQEQQNTNDINRQINDLNNPANEQALTAALEAQKSQALLDTFNKASDRAYQVGRDTVGDNQWRQGFDHGVSQDTFNNGLNLSNVTGTYNGQNTMANTQMLAQLTGKYNGQNTYQAQQDAIQNAMNQAQLTGKLNGQNTLANTQMIADLTGKYNGQNTFDAKKWALELGNQKKQFKTTQAWQQHVFNNLSATDQAQLKQDLTKFDKTQVFDYYATKSQQETAIANNQYTTDAAYNGSALNLIP